MAGELAFDFQAGRICYCQVWNGAAFETYNSLSGNLSTYPVAVAGQGTASAH